MIPDRWAASVPAELLKLHGEALLLLEINPARSHELARLCLGKVISNFCAIHYPRLVDQVAELCDLWEAHAVPQDVSPTSIRLLDEFCRRSEANRHLDKDPSITVDAFHVLERLFDDWYVARADRALRRSRIGLV